MGDRKGIRPVKTTGCWFVDGDDLTVTAVRQKFCNFTYLPTYLVTYSVTYPCKGSNMPHEKFSFIGAEKQFLLNIVSDATNNSLVTAGLESTFSILTTETQQSLKIQKKKNS